MNEPCFYLNGAILPLGERRFAAAQLLRLFGFETVLPAEGELPYLFCGNGSCRDCNLMVDGIADIPSCRLPLASGMALRSGEGAGEPNALSAKLPLELEGKEMTCDVLVVGAGIAGSAAASEARFGKVDVLVADAKLRPPSDVAVRGGRVFVFDGGARRPVTARALVLATGARDSYPAFAGSLLPGVVPMELLERYAELDVLPGRRFLLVGGDQRARVIERRLVVLGAELVKRSGAQALASISGKTAVEQARLFDPARGSETVAADTVAIAGHREPSLALAKALGCATAYDREARYERLEIDEDGGTSVPGVFAAGDAVRCGEAMEAVASGRRAGAAAAAFARNWGPWFHSG